MKIILLPVASILIVLATALLVVSAVRAQNANVVVHDAWVRVPLPAQNQTALYFVIENHSSTPRAIVSASSGAAEKIEMHEEKMDATKKMMSMAPVARIAVPANGKVTLQPGGYHMMVFGLKSRPMAGANFPVTVKLDDGTTIEVAAAIRDQAESSPGNAMKDMKK